MCTMVIEIKGDIGITDQRCLFCVYYMVLHFYKQILTPLTPFSQGAIATPMYNLKGSKMLKKDHAPNFPLQHAHKDMKLAVDMAKEAKVEYAVTEKAEELFQKARSDKELDVAEQDFSAVFEKVHKESNSQYSKKRRLE